MTRMTQSSELSAAFAAALVPEGEAVTPRDSASVLVLDGSRVPWQVLMLRRPRGADFAPGAWVFPGGSVSAGDAACGDPVRGAALRELWEEVGLLLATRGDGGGGGPATGDHAATGDDAARVRAAVAGGLDFWAALAGEGLVAAPERLVPLTRWITPMRLRRRYDTRFYVAPAPGQPVVAQPGEVSAWRWVTAAEALRWSDAELVHATRRILDLVSPYPDAEALLNRLADRPEDPPVRPWIVEEAGRLRVADDARPLFP